MATTKKKTSGSKSTSKKSTGKKAAKKSGNKADAAKAAEASAEPVDPREPIPISVKTLDEAVTAIEALVSGLTPPAEPVQLDLVDAFLHLELVAGLTCGVGQEALRRIWDEYVDRNEFRITEAFEVEILLGGLGIPDLFERSRTVQQAINQIYADQNKVSLDHLREAAISERKNFFQRVPAITNDAARRLADVLSWEEIVFSQRSTQRVQQRVGLEGNAAEEAVLNRLRAVLAPFGHIPLAVGPERPDGSGPRAPAADPALCPLCLLLRLAPAGKK
ncbi:MAG: hypothetical protein O2865_13735 [Planctomycetota bacterium]|nr:hypothetical protein [Planctomycetota bacterium]MDA0933356.1 hypothetical protein [Planctomycetota bacterium]